MRVISGCRRGHKLAEFEGDFIRPTTDRVKESLFNLISQYITDARVLDLFAGSGGLGIEALSRGAEHCTFVDCDSRSIEIVNKNITALRFSDCSSVVNKTADLFLEDNRCEFDLIFLDPPYNKGIIEPVLDKIRKNSALSRDGVVVLESDSTDMHRPFDGYEILKQRKYGRTYVTVYKRGVDF